MRRYDVAMTRGVYWDLTPGESLDGTALPALQKAYLHDHGFARVHLWLNDQPPLNPNDCIWPSPFQTRWPLAQVETFVRALQDNHCAAVFTLSPWFANADWLDGLAGVFALAARLGAGVEFDLEGNLTDHYQPPHVPNALTPRAAKAHLLSLLADHGPGVPFGVSTTRAHLPEHADLVGAAGWISPQSYGKDAVAGDVRSVRSLNPHAPIWTTLSVENLPPPHPDNVPLDVFAENLKAAEAAGSGAAGVLIWSRHFLTRGNDGCNGWAYAAILAHSARGPRPQAL